MLFLSFSYFQRIYVATHAVKTLTFCSCFYCKISIFENTKISKCNFFNLWILCFYRAMFNHAFTVCNTAFFSGFNTLLFFKKQCKWIQSHSRLSEHRLQSLYPQKSTHKLFKTFHETKHLKLKGSFTQVASVASLTLVNNGPEWDENGIMISLPNVSHEFMNISFLTWWKWKT